MNARGTRVWYIYTEAIAEFGNSIGFVLPTTICKENIRNLLLVKELQGPCAGRNGIGAKHEDTVDVKGEGIIQGRMMSIAFAKVVDGAEPVPSRSEDVLSSSWTYLRADAWVTARGRDLDHTPKALSINANVVTNLPGDQHPESYNRLNRNEYLKQTIFTLSPI